MTNPRYVQATVRLAFTEDPGEAVAAAAVKDAIQDALTDRLEENHEVAYLNVEVTRNVSQPLTSDEACRAADDACDVVAFAADEFFAREHADGA